MRQLPPDHPLTMALDGLNRPQTLAIYYDASRRGPGLLWNWLKRLALESFQTDPRYPAVPEDMPDDYTTAGCLCRRDLVQDARPANQGVLSGVAG